MVACKVLVADPPWKFGDKLPGETRGAARQYDVMNNRDIVRFPLPPLADVAHLFLWRVASMQQEALDVASFWGFTVKSELVWLKRTKTGKRHFGMGRQVRNEHEVCLIATRGGAKPLVKNVRSTFEAPMPVDENGAVIHSAKPDAFFDIVEELCGAPEQRGTHVELFARRHRRGWQCLGNEL